MQGTGVVWGEGQEWRSGKRALSGWGARDKVTGLCGREREKVNEKNLMKLMIDNKIHERERIV